MDLKFKNNSNTFKDVDKRKGIITGYASVFGNKDSDGDIIVKGAYSKTIQENKERIAFLYQHDIRKPIGKNLNLLEDTHGLKFEASFSRSTLGQDVLTMVDEGIIKEVSVGFNTVKGEPKDDHYEIKEVKLWEYSLVTLAANPMANVTGLKGIEDIEAKAKEEIEKLSNFMRKGSVSDETFKMIEFQIEYIKNIMSLEKEPQQHSKEEPTFDFNKFNKFLKN